MFYGPRVGHMRERDGERAATSIAVSQALVNLQSRSLSVQYLQRELFGYRTCDGDIEPHGQSAIGT